MPESVYDRCQRTTELFEGRVPCRTGFRPAFGALLILLGYALIALIRQRLVVQVHLGPLSPAQSHLAAIQPRIIRELQPGLDFPSLNISQPYEGRRGNRRPATSTDLSIACS